jgi:hypothetical protein
LANVVFKGMGNAPQYPTSDDSFCERCHQLRYSLRVVL